jgi:hypothetical protein
MLRLILKALSMVLRILLNHGGLFGVFSVLGMGGSMGWVSRRRIHYHYCYYYYRLRVANGTETPIGVGESRKRPVEAGHSVNPFDAQTLRDVIKYLAWPVQRMGMLTLDKVVGRVLAH